MKSTYWTTFCFDNAEPSERHCTHKFLGPLNPLELELLIDDLMEYFEEKPFKHFMAKFDLEDRFGVKKDITVYKASSLAPFDNFADLRKVLDRYRVDDFPVYLPHVTTNEPVVGFFNRYALMSGKEVLAEWRT